MTVTSIYACDHTDLNGHTRACTRVRAALRDGPRARRTRAGLDMGAWAPRVFAAARAAAVTPE